MLVTDITYHAGPHAPPLGVTFGSWDGEHLSGLPLSAVFGTFRYPYTLWCTFSVPAPGDRRARHAGPLTWFTGYPGVA